MRYEDLEFRKNSGARNSEIVAWSPYPDSDRGEEFCFTLLWWKKDKEGYYIEYVGSRPLEYSHPDRLLHMLRYGQSVLDAEYKFMEGVNKNG
jgi:hypothetical protein